MLKAVGAALVVFSCSALGCCKSMALKRRLHQLMEIEKLVTLLLGEITYRKEALPEALFRVAEKTEEPFCGFLKEVSETAEKYQGVCFADIFREKAKLYLKDSQISRADMEKFSRLGEYLGYLDINMQKNTAALYLEELRREIQSISKELPGKQKMYQSLGILGGIFLTIMFL